jgi:hypothetical protein
MYKSLRRSHAAVVGICCALAGAAIVPVAGLAGITGSTGDGPMVLQSGESSATYTALLNIATLPANGYKQLWTRVGDTVTVTGAFPVSASVAGGASAQVYIPLPVDSEFTSAIDCVGTASANSTVSEAARIFGGSDAGHTHQCVVEWRAATTGEQWVHYAMNYRVRG